MSEDQSQKAAQVAMDVDSCVTCSDASESGGGVSKRVGLTRRGKDRLEEAVAERSRANSKVSHETSGRSVNFLIVTK